MTMHLEGPWLSTSGKKRGKKKFRNAEEARKARELDASWLALQKKWAVKSEPKKTSATATLSSSYSLKIPEGRNTTAHIKSLDSGLGIAAKRESQRYTGTKVKGIGTMHKSNAVPIFSDDEARDIAKMRR
jgi:hypothetical protein